MYYEGSCFSIKYDSKAMRLKRHLLMVFLIDKIRRIALAQRTEIQSRSYEVSLNREPKCAIVDVMTR